jgi:hypothetical protein
VKATLLSANYRLYNVLLEELLVAFTSSSEGRACSTSYKVQFCSGEFNLLCRMRYAFGGLELAERPIMVPTNCDLATGLWCQGS